MSKNPNVKELRKILNESLFNPNDPGYLSIIVDMADPDYYVSKSIEFLQRYKQDRAEDKQFNVSSLKLSCRDQLLIDAIQLLALARAFNAKAGDQTK